MLKVLQRILNLRFALGSSRPDLSSKYLCMIYTGILWYNGREGERKRGKEKYKFIYDARRQGIKHAVAYVRTRWLGTQLTHCSTVPSSLMHRTRMVIYASEINHNLRRESKREWWNESKKNKGVNERKEQRNRRLGRVALMHDAAQGESVILECRRNFMLGVCHFDLNRLKFFFKTC